MLEASLQQLQRSRRRCHSLDTRYACLPVTERPCTRTTHRCMLIGVPLSDRLAVRGGLRVSRGHQSMCPQGGARVNDSHFRHYWECHLFMLSSPRRAHGVTHHRTERDPSASPARATPWHRERPRGLCNRVKSVHDVCLVWCTARRSPQHRCNPSTGFSRAGGEGALYHVLLHLQHRIVALRALRLLIGRWTGETGRMGISFADAVEERPRMVDKVDLVAAGVILTSSMRHTRMHSSLCFQPSITRTRLSWEGLT